MHIFWICVFLFTIFISFTTANQITDTINEWESFIKCPLVWEEAAIGDIISENSVPATKYGRDNFVARATMQDDTIVIGRLEKGIVYSVNKTEVVKSPRYEILTNPNGCMVEWISGPTIPHFPISADNSNEGFVGRAIDNRKQQSGHVANGILSFVDDTENARNVQIFEYLQSYSRGLRLEITSFKLDNDPFSGSQEMLGTDTIINNADVWVGQTVRHSKKVFESTYITTSKTWGHTFKVGIKIEPEFKAEFDEGGEIEYGGASFPLLDLEYNIEYPKGKFTEFYSETSNLLEFEREILVPPFTSVQMCSTLRVVDNFAFSYKALGKYFAPGLSANDVAQILAKDQLEGEKNDDSVIVEMTGVFAGTLAVSNEFITVPLGSEEGCSKLSKKINEVKKGQAFSRLNSTEIANKKIEINKLIKQLSKNSL